MRRQLASSSLNGTASKSKHRRSLLLASMAESEAKDPDDTERLCGRLLPRLTYDYKLYELHLKLSAIVDIQKLTQ